MTTHTQPKAPGTPTWVDLLAHDLDTARTFYHAVFGWEYEIGSPEYGFYTNAWVGGRVAAGMGGPMPDAPPVPSAWSLYFASHDIEADVARAVELGAQVHVAPMEVAPFGSMAILADPTGAAFGFWQAKEHIGSQVNDEPGAAAWYELSTLHAQQARDFYCALLNAVAEPMPGGPEYYVLKRGDDSLCAVMQSDPADGQQPQWMTYFGVSDVDVAVGALTTHGGAVLSPIDATPFGRMVTVADPEGAQFKLVEVE